MSVNKAQPHLLILPEDDADRQIAVGFDRELGTRQVQVLPPAGGWMKALEKIGGDYQSRLTKYPDALLAVIIDFDKDLSRIDYAREQVPETLRDRVFILGAASRPEDLRKSGLGKFEEIGEALARDCRNGTLTVWRDDQLRHNLPEAERLRDRLGWLFEL